jgi:hypothetical protein
MFPSRCFSRATGRPGSELGSALSFPFERGASTAAKRGGQRTGARWVGRSRIRRFGFWVFGLLPSSIDTRRRSSFPMRAILPWALASLRFHGCDRSGERARTNGRERSVAFHRSPGRGFPRPYPLMSFASGVSACGCAVGKQCRCRPPTELARWSRPFALGETRRVGPFAADVPSAY